MTKPERIAKKILESLGYIVKHYKEAEPHDAKNTFYQEMPFGKKRLDFAMLTSKIAIEVNGSYWHAEMTNSVSVTQLKQKIKDAEKKTSLQKDGWRTIVLSESSLCGRIDACRKHINKEILASFLV